MRKREAEIAENVFRKKAAEHSIGDVCTKRKKGCATKLSLRRDLAPREFSRKAFPIFQHFLFYYSYLLHSINEFDGFDGISRSLLQQNTIHVVQSMMIAFANATSDDDTEGDIINTYLLDERLRG